MKSKIAQIRDVQIIEKELASGKAGVLAFNSSDEELVQAALPYLYLDKNVYFFFEESDENFLNIILESNVSFTVVKIENGKKNSEASGYKYLQIVCRGTIRKVEENKYAEEVYRQFTSRYGGKTENEDSYIGIRALFIDTEEIQSSEISGS